jgi:hypothetical protein
MGFTADRFKAFVQLATVDISRQHGRTVALRDAPEYAIEQAPAVFHAETRCTFQQFQ